MKNLKTLILNITALAVIILLLNTPVYSQQTTVDTTRIDTTQMDAPSQTSPQDQYQRTNENTLTDDDEGVNYGEELKKKDLPKEVTNSLKELYPAHEIKDVFRGDDDSYKVKVQNKNDKAVVYFNSEGSFLRAKNESDMQGAYPQEQGQRTRDSQTQGQWGTNQGTQSGSQGQWGTERGSDTRGTQGTQGSQWGTERGSDTRGTQGTQGSQWGTGDTTKNEGSAYPQEQNQRTKDQWGTQKDRSTDSELGTEDRTGTQGQYGTQNDRSTSGTQGQYGTRSDRTTGTQGQYGAQRMGNEDVNYSEELKKNDLPREVTNSLKELYPAHKITEAYRGEDDSYKVKVENKDDKAIVYYNSEGSFLRATNENDMQGAFPQEQGQRTRDNQNQGQWGTNQGTQQQGQGQWGSERGSDTRGTQGSQWGTGDTTKNEGSAYPQEQNQRSQDQWGTQKDMGTDRDLGTEDRTGTQGEFGTKSDRSTGTQSDRSTGTQGQYGTHSDRTGQHGTSKNDNKSMGKSQGSASSQDQMQRTGDGDVDYSEELKENDLPESVKNSLKELYPAHKIDKVYQGNDDSFKVKVKNQDDEAAVYYNSNGDFLRAENLKNKENKTNSDW